MQSATFVSKHIRWVMWIGKQSQFSINLKQESFGKLDKAFERVMYSILNFTKLWTKCQ